MSAERPSDDREGLDAEKGTRDSRLLEHATNVLTILAAALLGALTLYLVAQPIYANDTWIHLALGEAFAAAGPWLESDPHLFAAPGPPAPSSWLGSTFLFWIHDLAGFTGLRALHVVLVLGILVLAWRVLRVAGARVWAASLGTILFITLSTYRLVQLRPDLLTIAFVLALYPWLIAPRRGPSKAAIGLAALVGALWANLHAGFLLGPLLLLGVAASLAVWARLPGQEARSDCAPRTRGVAAAGGAMLLGSLLNPLGPAAHTAYFASGGETLALAAVSDEWNPTRLLAWPIPELPPSLAAWLVCWLTVIALVAGGLVLLLDRKRAGSEATGDASMNQGSLDPALWALGVAGLLATIQASRFLWLALFGVAVLASLVSRQRPGAGAGVAARVAVAGLAWAGAWLHLTAGDWPMVSKAVVAGIDYELPYRPSKFYAEAVWFLDDTGVEGRVYNDYLLGGFMSFWLTPELMMASSGTMNVEISAMESNLAIGARESLRPGETYGRLLDRQGFDLFMGVGLPMPATDGYAIPSTVRHLEREPGWIPVFRSLRTAVYLRQNDANRENLERIATYYDEAGVPFDRDRGFDVERVIVRAPDWAIRHGLIPIDFENLVASVRASRAQSSFDASIHRLALLYATLGLYDRAQSVDRSILRLDRVDVLAARRLLWNLMQARRFETALEVARDLDEGPLGRDRGIAWSDSVERIASLEDRDEQSRTLALMPLLDLVDGPIVQSGFLEPPARKARARAR